MKQIFAHPSIKGRDFGRLDKGLAYSYLQTNSKGEIPQVIRRCLNKLMLFLRPESENGQFQESKPEETLAAIYARLSTLAEQIDNDADKAPYSHVSDQLRRIAASQRADALLIKDQIQQTGRMVKQSGTAPISAKNHWERLRQDLQALKEIENLLLIHNSGMDQPPPDIQRLISQFAARLQTQKTSLNDLIARADPQANLS